MIMASAPNPHRRFGKLRRLPSGRWQASYLGPDAARHVAPHTFLARVDAEGWLNDRRRSIELGTWTMTPAAAPAAPITMTEYATAWLGGRDLKARTRVEYRRLLEQVILPPLGPLPVQAITPAVVRGWYAGLNPKTPTRRAHAYQLLRSVLFTAVDDELLPANPCRITGAGTTKRARKIRPATIAELAAIAEATPDRYRPMVLLAAWCALRFGELAELRRGDVDLKAGVLRVRRGVTRAEGVSVVDTPKSEAGVRDVAIPPHLRPMVAEHLRTVMTGRDGLLFPSFSGRHLTGGNQIQNWWDPARQAAGRPDLTFHDLRHTGATLAAQSGATLAELMARLGHSTPGAALRYQHAAAGRDQVIAAALSRLAEQ
jgi:integrase